MKLLYHIVSFIHNRYCVQINRIKLKLNNLGTNKKKEIHLCCLWFFLLAFEVGRVLIQNVAINTSILKCFHFTPVRILISFSRSCLKELLVIQPYMAQHELEGHNMKPDVERKISPVVTYMRNVNKSNKKYWENKKNGYKGQSHGRKQRNAGQKTHTSKY